ncbi:MAG TPA: hypothetical protein DD435_07030 [Cyanobacteria bacterium UBA8530]|nr:hypothetical protein [Cyanobacteria bacterium UBA8530]
MSRKEELKAAYKQNWHKLRTMGVYQIKNRANGKVFLEASLNLEGTIDRDRMWLTMGGHQNQKLQQEWDTFGAQTFTIEILETLTPTDDPRDYALEAKILLEIWLETLSPYGEKGYLPPPRR